MCFVIATEYIGTSRWGKDGEIDNIFAQDSSHIGTIKKDYWGRENQNAYLEYDTSNTDYAFNKANSYLFKNGQNGYVGGAGEFFLISLYANEINECLLMVGGTIMSNRMWTSTRNEKFTYSWYYIFLPPHPRLFHPLGTFSTIGLSTQLTPSILTHPGSSLCLSYKFCQKEHS